MAQVRIVMPTEYIPETQDILDGTNGVHITEIPLYVKIFLKLCEELQYVETRNQAFANLVSV